MTTEQLKAKIKEALPDCEELRLFEENRKRDVDNPYIPSYHFCSPGGYLNDPNGYCYYKGVYHLFYQFSPEHQPSVSWGHAASVDLIHWIDLPRALIPTIEDWCGSGNILFEEDRAIACYPGNLKGKKGNDIHLAQCTDDLLIHWTPLETSIITTLDENGNRKPYIAYDPFLWKEGDTYYLISGGGGALPYFNWQLDFKQELLQRREFLFTSKDLKHWEYHHSIIEDDIYCAVGDDGGCPYFLPFGEDKHVLLHYSHRSGGKYVIGEYDKKTMKFHSQNGGAFNAHGWFSGVHAPSAFAAENGDVHCIFNVNFGIYNGPVNQICSLPRRFKLGERNTLLQTPAGDYQSLRYDHVGEQDKIIPANTEVVLDTISGSALEIDLTADVVEKRGENFFNPANLFPMFEVRVLRSSDAKEYTSIRFYRNRTVVDWEAPSETFWPGRAQSVIEVDTSHSTLHPDAAIHPTEHQRYTLHSNDPVKLQIFVDKGIVEVFANGKQCVTVRSYPTLEDSVGVSLYSAGVDAKVSYDAWKMKNIYKD